MPQYLNDNHRRNTMPPSVLSAFLVFTFITAFTPGPNNILALSVGSRCGLKGSAPVLAGICSGFFCVMLLCGVLVFSLSSLSEQFIEIMKYVGCLYIVWLTWKIATARQKEEENPNSATGFMTGFILQFVNRLRHDRLFGLHSPVSQIRSNISVRHVRPDVGR
jgi:cysteine/O-acetylserine efflux protein